MIFLADKHWLPLVSCVLFLADQTVKVLFFGIDCGDLLVCYNLQVAIMGIPTPFVGIRVLGF